MLNFSNVVYIVRFTETKKDVVKLHGLEALSRFASNDLYTVEHVDGTDLTEVELNEWERLTDLLFGVVELPRGFGHA